MLTWDDATCRATQHRWVRSLVSTHLDSLVIRGASTHTLHWAKLPLSRQRYYEAATWRDREEFHCFLQLVQAMSCRENQRMDDALE